MIKEIRTNFKVIQILYHLQNKKISVYDLNKLLNGTYYYTHKITNILIKLQLISCEKKGRKKLIQLTPTGLNLLKKWLAYYEEWNKILEQNNMLVDRQNIFLSNPKPSGTFRSKLLKKII